MIHTGWYADRCLTQMSCERKKEKPRTAFTMRGWIGTVEPLAGASTDLREIIPQTVFPVKFPYLIPANMWTGNISAYCRDCASIWGIWSEAYTQNEPGRVNQQTQVWKCDRARYSTDRPTGKLNKRSFQLRQMSGMVNCASISLSLSLGK